MLFIIFIGVPLGWGINKIIGPLARVDIKVRPYFKRVYFADLRFWEYTQWGDFF